MRGSFALLSVLLVVGTGCPDRTRITPPPVDAGPVCEANEKLVNGMCRFVCQRDGDCAAGQRCNLLSGTCEPKPPEPDASVFVPCTEGARRCSVSGSAVELCGANGRFSTEMTCPAPDGFCANERCLVCRPNATKCAAAPNQLEVCETDGSGFRTVTCAGMATCTMGECRECTAGERRCSPDGRAVQECQRRTQLNLSTTWVNVGDNFDGTCITQQCMGMGAQSACVPPTCIPGSTQCQSSAVQQTCNATGRWDNVTCTTVPGLGPTAECQNGACIDECADAVRQKSYFGCEYWTAVMDNSMDALFKGRTASGQGNADSDFVFVVTNQSTLSATVSVWRHFNGSPTLLKTVTVPGQNDPSRGLSRIAVPWQSISPASTPTGEAITGRARYAYRLTSTRPITVYQFNPIDAVKVTSRTCTAAAGTSDCACNEYSEYTATGCGLLGLSCCSPGVCTTGAGGSRVCSYGTFSNDASLLLPAHILGTGYVAITPGHSHIVNPPGSSVRSSQIVIVAPEDNTQVTIRSSGVTRAGTGIPAFSAGESRMLTLQSYEVLTLASATSGGDLECQNFGGGASWCRKANDLTGTIITSDKPIAVFGSNPCLNVPWARPFCDHVEEQVFPFSTWGRNFVALPSHPLRLNNNNFSTNPPPDHFKIVAGAAVTLTLTPPPMASDVIVPNNCLPGTSLQANNCQLAGGSFIEFRSVRAFTISANAPIAVAQFLPGQGQIQSPPLPTDPSQGDPSMILLPPIEQWRSRYTVLASTGLRDNYLALAIDSSRVLSVSVDGMVVTGFASIAGSNFQVKNHPVSTGTHTIQVTPRPGQTVLPGAGVTIYGYDAQVSYGYTGGLDLTTIVTGINPGG